MDQGAVFSTGKSGPIFLRQTKNQSQANDFRSPEIDFPMSAG